MLLLEIFQELGLILKFLEVYFFLSTGDYMHFLDWLFLVQIKMNLQASTLIHICIYYQQWIYFRIFHDSSFTALACIFTEFPFVI